MSSWQKQLLNVSAWLIFAALVGTFTHLLFPLLFFTTLVLLMQHLKQVCRFEQWVSMGGRGRYPKAKGIWEDIYYHVYRMKKAERKRKKKLGVMIDQFRQSTEALPDAAVVLSANDEIEWINKAAREVLGLQTSDKGQRIPNLIRFPDFIRYLKSEHYQEAVILPSPTNKNIILAVRIVSYGAGLRLLLAQDVTQLKKMETMRKDFVANVSHELRTPLTVLKGYLETLQDNDDGLSPLLTASFHQMLGQTERMQHLVDDLLLLTRLETQKKKIDCVNVPILLQEIIEETNSPRLELSINSLAKINGDEQELRSAFSNLIGNALKYSPDDSPVKVRWLVTESALILEVEDFGEGIAAHNIARVTERFYRVEVKRRKRINGTGLGLAIVKHVLMRHDAELQIRSEVGKGSCFSCHFALNRAC